MDALSCVGWDPPQAQEATRGDAFGHSVSLSCQGTMFYFPCSDNLITQKL